MNIELKLFSENEIKDTYQKYVLKNQSYYSKLMKDLIDYLFKKSKRYHQYRFISSTNLDISSKINY